MACRGRLMKMLSDEAALEEIVQLVGMDALSAPDRLKMEAARSIREDFLHQDSFHEVDTYTALDKQFLMMKLILAYYDLALEALEKGASVDALVGLAVREKIGRYKYTTQDKIQEEYDNILAELKNEIASINCGEA